MNLNTHLVLLDRIRTKMERGEEPTEAEKVYVRVLFRAVMRAVRPIVEALARSTGTTVLQLATRLEEESIARRRGVVAERDAAREMMVTAWHQAGVVTDSGRGPLGLVGEAQAVVDSALSYARFQAHGSFERFAKFYGESLGAELGDRARRTKGEERGVSDTERLIEEALRDARENIEFFPVGGEHEPYRVMGRQMERSANLTLALCDALSASLEREREARDALETIERGSRNPNPASPSRLVNINSVARRGLQHLSAARPDGEGDGR